MLFRSELLHDWLEAEGYQVLTADNLHAGFAAVRSQPPNAILLDIQLGGDDGLSLVSWLRRQPALQHIPVIAVTAHAMLSEQKRILEAGCNDILSKPINFRLLRECLERRLAAYGNEVFRERL